MTVHNICRMSYGPCWYDQNHNSLLSLLDLSFTLTSGTVIKWQNNISKHFFHQRSYIFIKSNGKQTVKSHFILKCIRFFMSTFRWHSFSSMTEVQLKSAALGIHTHTERLCGFFSVLLSILKKRFYMVKVWQRKGAEKNKESGISIQ